MLSEPTILELQKILKEEFGIEYSLTESNEAASYLVRYAETLLEVENKYE